jgi:hypothetical protein
MEDQETTLTIENLQAIIDAMALIKRNDRSDYFKAYYTEVVMRLWEKHQELLYMKINKNQKQ